MHRLHTHNVQYNKHGGPVILKRTFGPRLRSPGGGGGGGGTYDPRLACPGDTWSSDNDIYIAASI